MLSVSKNMFKMTIISKVQFHITTLPQWIKEEFYNQQKLYLTQSYYYVNLIYAKQHSHNKNS